MDVERAARLLEGLARARELLEAAAAARAAEALNKNLCGMAAEAAAQLGEEDGEERYVLRRGRLEIVSDSGAGTVTVRWGGRAVLRCDYSTQDRVVRVYRPGEWERELVELYDEARRGRLLREAAAMLRRMRETAEAYGLDLERFLERAGLSREELDELLGEAGEGTSRGEGGREPWRRLSRHPRVAGGWRSTSGRTRRTVAAASWFGTAAAS